MDIHPKVAASAVGGTIGGALTVLLIWILQASGVPEAQFTSERVVALTTILSAGIGLWSGYVKSGRKIKLP